MPRTPIARLAEILCDREDDTAASVVTTAGDVVEIALFADGTPTIRTVLLDPRRGLSVTTDARLLYARVIGPGRLARLALVDCSMARVEGLCPVTVTAATTVRDLDVMLPDAGPCELASSAGLQDSRVHVSVGEARPVESATRAAGSAARRGSASW
jgi:hypothetical protein